MFAPEIGKLRALYAAAHKEVAKAERAERCREEMEEAEVLARAKTEAKEAAKEAAKDALKEKDCRKVPAKTKIALEEALGQKHPGTPGLTGKQHSSTGRSFLQILLGRTTYQDGKTGVLLLPLAPAPPPNPPPDSWQDDREGGSRPRR